MGLQPSSLVALLCSAVVLHGRSPLWSSAPVLKCPKPLTLQGLGESDGLSHCSTAPVSQIHKTLVLKALLQPCCGTSVCLLFHGTCLGHFSLEFNCFFSYWKKIIIFSNVTLLWLHPEAPLGASPPPPQQWGDGTRPSECGILRAAMQPTTCGRQPA